MKSTVIIIGGGGTGIALAWELSLRGLTPILLEQGEFTSGTTGRHHGQLHSGARYAVEDKVIAAECMEETRILLKIAPESIEFNKGIFVALDDSHEEYSETFLASCKEAGIPTKQLSGARCRELEPGLSEKVTMGIEVPDGTFDAFRLPMMFLAGALSSGASARRFCRVTGFIEEKGKAAGVVYTDLITGKEETLRGDAVVSAAGAWAGKVAGLESIPLSVTPAPGTLVARKGRIVNRVISALRPPGDGDILVPQRNQTIIGTTQWEVKEPDGILPRQEDLPYLLSAADTMVPEFSTGPVVSAWAAPRPLFGNETVHETSAGGTKGRRLSRDFGCVQHRELPGFFSILGGKATVLRAMAEKSADEVCAYLGLKRDESWEKSRTQKLPSWRVAMTKLKEAGR